MAEGVDIVNLELGGGPNKRAGYVSLDMHAWDGATDIVADLEADWPIESGTVDSLYSCHVVEHVSWRKLEHVIRECWRVLRPGGTCTHGWPEMMRMMNLLPAMCDCVRQHDVFAGDPDCPRCHGKARVHPAYMKASFCGLQAYPGDVHRNVIPESELAAMMQRAGFSITAITTDETNPLVCWIVGVK